MLSRLILTLAALIWSTSAFAQHNHAAWDSLLKKNVVVTKGGSETFVNYGKFKADRAKLKAYLASTSKVSRGTFNRWPKNDRLAFLINVYNAYTVELILTKYPNLKSIKDLGSFVRSPWKKAFIPLFGKKVSLDDIEHGMIRGSGKFNEPRIHFAVNCASIGCPALANSAYTGRKLEGQLQRATNVFLRDRSRNRVRGNTAQVSSIFKWYRSDFGKGWRGARNLNQFLALYSGALGLNKTQAANLKSGKTKVSFLSYNWNLNRTR